MHFPGLCELPSTLEHFSCMQIAVSPLKSNKEVHLLPLDLHVLLSRSHSAWKVGAPLVCFFSFSGESLPLLITSLLPPSSFSPPLLCVLWRRRSSIPKWRRRDHDVITFSPTKLNGEGEEHNFSWLSLLCPLHGSTVNQSESCWQLAMDCTAAILKACARSRAKWCCHGRSSVRHPWGPANGCGCGRGVFAGGFVNHTSSLLRRLLLHVCCCHSHEESSQLCRDWGDCPIQGVERDRRGRRQEEGESDGSLYGQKFLFYQSNTIFF